MNRLRVLVCAVLGAAAAGCGVASVSRDGATDDVADARRHDSTTAEGDVPWNPRDAVEPDEGLPERDASTDDDDARAPLDAADDARDGGAATDARADAVVRDGATPMGRVLFNGDFETGDLSQWDYVGQCMAGRITVYSAATAPAGAPAPRQGRFAARLRVLDTDVAPCTSTSNPRAQLQSSLTLFRPGDEAWEAWSLYVPSDFPTLACGAGCVGSWLVFQQDYGPPWDGSPAIGWDISRIGAVDSLVMARGAMYRHDHPWHMPLVRGRWIDFLVHKRFANTLAGGGYVEAWVDGRRVTFSACGGCDRLSTQTMHASQTGVGFFLTHYRAQGLFREASIYLDGGRVGTTRESVELR